eukprot:6211804-Pleurochrysis_carterae.AAC.3
MSASLRQYGCASIWLTAGRIESVHERSRLCSRSIEQLHTPIAATRPSRTSDSMFAHVSCIASSSAAGQCTR